MSEEPRGAQASGGSEPSVGVTDSIQEFKDQLKEELRADMRREVSKVREECEADMRREVSKIREESEAKMEDLLVKIEDKMREIQEESEARIEELLEQNKEKIKEIQTEHELELEAIRDGLESGFRDREDLKKEFEELGSKDLLKADLFAKLKKWMNEIPENMMIICEKLKTLLKKAGVKMEDMAKAIKLRWEDFCREDLDRVLFLIFMIICSIGKELLWLLSFLFEYIDSGKLTVIIAFASRLLKGKKTDYLNKGLLKILKIN
ncbi:uncharacterized protein LOC144428182 [Styela clava]